jgi:hypothetical protein
MFAIEAAARCPAHAKACVDWEQVAKATRGMGNGGCKLVSSSLWVLQERHLAVYMASHRRLGASPNCLLSNVVGDCAQ